MPARFAAPSRNPCPRPRRLNGYSRPECMICREFELARSGAPVIRVGEVPGSNPGAPIEPLHLQGFTADGSVETRSPWRVGMGSGRRDPDDFSPMKCLQLRGCYLAVRSQWLPLERRSAAKGRAGGKPGKCEFVGVSCAGRGGLTAQSLPKVEPTGRLAQPRTAPWRNRSRARCATGTRACNWRTAGASARTGRDPLSCSPVHSGRARLRDRVCPEAVALSSTQGIDIVARLRCRR